MNEIEIIIKSIKDFFSSPMLKIALIPLIVDHDKQCSEKGHPDPGFLKKPQISKE